MNKYIKKITENPKNDILSGLTVALALVPEAVAFSFVAGVDPLVGLYGAFIMGLITSIFGGRPGMISGATGAMAVVMVALIKGGNDYGLAMETPIQNLGVQYLFLTLLLVGVIQIAAGVFKLGKFVRLIPHPVMMGFVNGLAIVIFMSQLGMFKTFEWDALGNRVMDEEGNYVLHWLKGSTLYIMGGLVLLTMGIMHFLPKLTTKIPSALTAIIVVAIISVTLLSGYDISTVGSFIRDGGGAGLKGSFPSFSTDMLTNIPLSLDTFKFIFPYALILAAVGLIESLMTLNLVDELTETHGNGNQECIAQGSANMLNGFFGGMGGCAMIGQSIINVKSGGRGRLSGIVASVTLLMFILFASAYIEQVPIAALVGVMFMVVIGTFAWSSFKIINKIPLADALVIVAVSGLTVLFDLAIAVVAGVIISALVFAWKNAIKIKAKKYTKENGTEVYEIWGALFFGSIQDFNTKFDVSNAPQNVEIDFLESKVSDHSGIEAIIGVTNKFKNANKNIILTHLSSDCKSIMTKLDPTLVNIIKEEANDPRYFVLADQDSFL